MGTGPGQHYGASTHEAMARLDEAAGNPTCGKLTLRAPEATDEEFRALITIGVRSGQAEAQRMTVAFDEDLLVPMLAGGRKWLIDTSCAFMCSVQLVRSLP